IDDGARGDGELEGLARLAGAQGTLPVRAALGGKRGMEPVVDEGVVVGARDDVHRATRAAVTAVGPALRDELLATEADGAAPAGSCRDGDVDFIDEHAGRGGGTNRGAVR